MEIVARVTGLGNAGTNAWMGIEYVTDTNLSGSGEVYFSPADTEGEIEAAIAASARDALRATGQTVPNDMPVTIIGGVRKV